MRLLSPSRYAIGRGSDLFDVALDGSRDRGVTPLDEGFEAAFEGRPLDQDVAAARLASQADVGAQPIDEPCGTATRMGTAKTDDVAKEQHHDRSVWHGGQGINQMRGWP
jgi:hypothetical protein